LILPSNMWSLPLILAITIRIFQLTESNPTPETYQITKNTVNNAADDVVKARADVKRAQGVLNKAMETARNAGKVEPKKEENAPEVDDCSFNGFLLSNCDSHTN
ncbi:hypothetical protein PENTCL1PPCAC_18613, partial [Pristionchus entomophagus]